MVWWAQFNSSGHEIACVESGKGRILGGRIGHRKEFSTLEKTNGMNISFIFLQNEAACRIYIVWIISPSMVSKPVLYHGARVLHEFQLPVLDSQPEFQTQQEVQTEPPPPTPAIKHDRPKHNALAESFLRSIQANFICPIVTPVTYCPEGHAVCFERCPICRSNSSVPGDCPFIYLRGIQDATESLMEGIAREFREVSDEDKESQDEELRSYARGPTWDHWKVRSRVGLAILRDIRQVRRQVDFVDVGRVVSWARGQLAASAQPSSAAGASAQLPM
ncbi:hypothetical protein EV702DRAFT_1048924 [Suillus placidus]|uniref:Uncharacterized protein n=1 Tax=Suillus placidus TaxID=48579 RepID=A0A9P6ZLQ9_9AGAM|nr:hypothetical protein EV702DRAFT_1048924 [Suillus placidus]